MRMYDIIAKKRDGGTLTQEEIAFSVKGFAAGSVPEPGARLDHVRLLEQVVGRLDTAQLGGPHHRHSHHFDVIKEQGFLLSESAGEFLEAMRGHHAGGFRRRGAARNRLWL